MRGRASCRDPQETVAARAAPCFRPRRIRHRKYDSPSPAVLFQSIQQRGAIQPARAICGETRRTLFRHRFGSLLSFDIDEYAAAAARQTRFAELAKPVQRCGQLRVTRTDNVTGRLAEKTETEGVTAGTPAFMAPEQNLGK